MQFIQTFIALAAGANLVAAGVAGADPATTPTKPARYFFTAPKEKGLLRHDGEGNDGCPDDKCDVQTNFLHGYDLLHGVPIQLRTDPGDPGTRQRIFDTQVDESNKQTIGGQTFYVPKHIQLTKGRGCEVDFQSTLIQGTKDYQGKH